MKKIIWITLMVIIGGYTTCQWDHYLSKYLFEKYCNEEGRVGLFIYEQVGLNKEYFMPFPVDKEPRDLDRRFIFGENLMINKERLEKDYIFDVYKSIPLSEIGPITSIETSVIRKSDKKILSKAVSIRSRKGWFSRIFSFGYASETCPPSWRESGFDVSEYSELHNTIIKKTFNKLTIQ
jgi:hypothetical protein